MSKEMSQEEKGELLGQWVRPKATGDYVVGTELLKKPLTYSTAVIRACCQGCGYCLEVPEGGAVHLLQLAKAERPDSWDGRYFLLQRCVLRP